MRELSTLDRVILGPIGKLILPITTFLAALSGLIISIFNVPILTIEMAADWIAANLAIFGPLAFAAAIGLVGGGAFVHGRYA